MLKAVSGEQLIDPAVLKRTAFYQDISRPYGLEHMAGAKIAERGRVRSFLILNRPSSIGPFHRAELELVGLLLHHTWPEHWRSMTALRLPTGSRWRPVRRLIWPQSGSSCWIARYGPLLINRYARNILRQRDGLSDSVDGIHASVIQENRRLRSLQIAALRVADIHSVDAAIGRCVVSRPSGRAAYDLLVCPLVLAEDKIDQDFREGRAILFIADPEQRSSPSAIMMTKWFDLTPAEGDVASLMASGLDAEHVAGALSLTVETARWYFKRILAKTSCHSRAEFVAKVMAGPALFALGRMPSL